MAQPCDLRVLLYPEDDVLFTAESVTIAPRVGEVIRLQSKEEDYIVTGVWHYYDGQADRLTVLVRLYKEYLAEIAGVDDESPAPARRGRPKSESKSN